MPSPAFWFLWTLAILTLAALVGFAPRLVNAFKLWRLNRRVNRSRTASTSAEFYSECPCPTCREFRRR